MAFKMTGPSLYKKSSVYKKDDKYTSANPNSRNPEDGGNLEDGGRGTSYTLPEVKVYASKQRELKKKNTFGSGVTKNLNKLDTSKRREQIRNLFTRSQENSK